jgi:tetratricopeptide (TPR) repeat protein
VKPTDLSSCLPDWAIAAIREADPNHADAYSSRALAYKDKRDYAKAIEDFGRALKIDQNNARAYNLRGFCYHNMGDADRALAALPQREREVIEMRFGLTGGRPRTLEEVCRAFNVTRERIRQIENQSLKKLESLPEAQRLRDAP